MTVCDLWRVLSPGIEIEIHSGGVEIANDLPFYFSNDLSFQLISDRLHHSQFKKGHKSMEARMEANAIIHAEGL